nr:phosphoglucosamine mutase [Chromatiaceae bacterium]
EQREIVGLPAMQAAVIAAEQELAGQGRILLRPSGTEPLIRVMVEGDDPVKVETIAQRLADLVRELI